MGRAPPEKRHSRKLTHNRCPDHFQDAVRTLGKDEEAARPRTRDSIGDDIELL